MYTLLKGQGDLFFKFFVLPFCFFMFFFESFLRIDYDV